MDAGASYHFQWNDEPWAIFSEPIFPPISGWNEIHYYAEDQLGNREAEQKINLYVDKIIPRLNVNWKFLPKTWNDLSVSQATNELRIRAIDDESGTEILNISLDGGPEIKIKGSNEWVLPTTSEGKHQVIAYAIDNVKNVSKKWEVTWLVDSTPPSISLQASPSSIKQTDKNICARNTRIQISSSDTITETKDLLWRKKDANVWTLTGRVFDLEKYFPYEKKIDLEFKARDFSGNESLPIPFSCEIDRTPPNTEIRIEK